MADGEMGGKKNIANLHVLGLFIPKNEFFFVRHAALTDYVGRNLYRQYLSRLNCYREIFATLHHLDWIDAPHTQNLENFKSLEKTQESKKLNHSNFRKICLLGCSICHFFRIGKF
jgi:hypothetical protein